MRRLSLAILSWTECLKGVSSDSTGIDTSMDTDPASSQPQHNLGGTPELGVSLYDHSACRYTTFLSLAEAPYHKEGTGMALILQLFLSPEILVLCGYITHVVDTSMSCFA